MRRFTVALLLFLGGSVFHHQRLLAAAAPADVCCPIKKIGNQSYYFFERNAQAITKFGCKNDCVYTITEDPDERICFGVGESEVSCELAEGFTTVLLGGFFTTEVESVHCDLNLPNITSVRTEMPDAAYLDEHLYICGGRIGGIDTNSCEALGPTGTWQPAPSMKSARKLFTMNTVGDRIVAIGGTGGSASTTEIFNGTSWNFGPTLESGVDTHCTATVSDTRVAIFAAGRYSLFDIDTGEVRVMPFETSDTFDRFQSTCSYDSATDLIILAGGGPFDDDRTVWTIKLSDTTAEWTLLPDSLPGQSLQGKMAIINGNIEVYNNVEDNTFVFEAEPGSNFTRGNWTKRAQISRVNGGMAIVPCSFRSVAGRQL